MSAFFDILDLDDSASLLPAVSFTVGGFPVTNLQALYLFEDGAVGSSPTTALDSSGNDNTATLVSGSSITRIAGGVKTGDSLNNGFLFDTPVAYSGSFTIVGVVRARAPTSTSGSFPTIHGASGSNTASGVGGLIGQNNTGTRGRLLLNQDSSTAVDSVNMSLYQTKTDGTTAWDGSGSIRPQPPAVSPRQTWVAYALSVNASTGELILRSNGNTLTFTALSDLTTFITGAGFHTFGYGRFGTSNVTMGDVGLFGIYSGASDVATLNSLIDCAKSRMTLRGITAV